VISAAWKLRTVEKRNRTKVVNFGETAGTKTIYPEEKAVLGSSPGKMTSVTRKLSMIDKWRQDQKYLLVSKLQEKDHNPENCSGFETR
jgi:hypothetical protein